MAGQENMYDEFGNYIGPDISSSPSDDESDSPSESSGNSQKHPKLSDEDEPQKALSSIAEKAGSDSFATRKLAQSVSNEIVLHEDKQYFPDASEVYPGVEVVTQLEDTQPIETPIIAPIKNKVYQEIERELPETTFSFKFMTQMMEQPPLVRHLCLLGQLHHGKTLFMDTLVRETHRNRWPIDREVRYTDTGKDEQERGVSIKSTPMSLILESLREKSYLLNIMDCPGHNNFSDEMTAAIRISDGAVIIVDAIEGVMKQTSLAIEHAVREGLPIVIVLNKMDRIILELKIPPNDAYHKLVGMFKEINDILQSLGSKQTISPNKNNVCFASALFGWSFTLKSFVENYYDPLCDDLDCEQMVAKLWGDWYFDHKTREFNDTEYATASKRGFVEFVLEPIYKIYSIVLGTDPKDLGSYLDSLGITLKKSELHWNPKPLLMLICKKFFKGSAGFVDMVVDNFPDPKTAAENKIKIIYSGDLTSECAEKMIKCETINAAPMVNIVKIYARPDCKAFDAFGRVFSGVVRCGDSVRVLREGYSLDDDEDMCVKSINDIWIYQGRYRVSINQVTAGNWALFSGIDAGITKTATLTSVEGNDGACIFRPLKFNTIATVKLAIEPLKPAELPKMLEALRHINNTYPLSQTKVEESGEHVLLGTGELYMDCIMQEMREKYSDIEIKVADPVARFSETVLETSTIPCFAQTPNKQNKLTMICEPLNANLAYAVEDGQLNVYLKEPGGELLAQVLETQYGWDALAARSVWAFGPDGVGPNVLIDDTLPSEIDKTKLSTIKNSIVQGFQWSTREGPLCDEPIRNCTFKIVEAEISENPLHRGGGQIIPTTRRVAYSAFLLATPRMMEPIYFVEIQAPIDCVAPIYHILGLRRGFVISETAKPGTPIFIINAHLPVIDSFGFETDLRTHTQGQAFCTSVFDHWEQVPGDPLDKSVELKPLEPAPPHGLAREFMTKTRQRKGLEEDVTAYKFFDDAMLFSLAEHEAEQEGDD